MSLDVAAGRQARWDNATANGIALAPVSNGEWSSAIASLGLPPQGQQSLLMDVAAGKVQLGYLTVYDDAAEDGDTLQVQSNWALDDGSPDQCGHSNSRAVRGWG